MIELTLTEARRLRPWFTDERPGPDTIAAHVLSTEHGKIYVDRWPEPRAVLVESAGNYLLRGEPRALTVTELRPHVHGFVAAHPAFERLLRGIGQRFAVWPRVVAELAELDTPANGRAAGVVVRRLGPADADAIGGLDTELSWISLTWGGPSGLAASGYGWGAFVDGQLVSVACTFFRGERYEDIGVVTAPEYQGRNLSTRCVAALCAEILDRGRQPTWSTSTDNLPSQRVAEKAGFRWVRDDVLYVVGVKVPA
jgi:RimJ/RimL family protein N-acetyltransferase